MSYSHWPIPRLCFFYYLVPGPHLSYLLSKSPIFILLLLFEFYRNNLQESLPCLFDWLDATFFFLTDTSGKSWMISFSGSSEIEQGWGRMAINLQATLIWNRSLGTFTNIIKIMWKSLRISSFLFSNISAPSS